MVQISLAISSKHQAEQDLSAGRLVVQNAQAELSLAQSAAQALRDSVAEGIARFQFAQDEILRLQGDLAVADKRFEQEILKRDQDSALLKQDIEFARKETSRAQSELQSMAFEVFIFHFGSSVSNSNFDFIYDPV
jgi:uncharacterized protein YejL (UPF0352 family)